MPACAVRRTTAAQYPFAKLAAHFGRQSLKLVLNEDGAVRLVPSGNLVI
jgi:hypothetical protein